MPVVPVDVRDCNNQPSKAMVVAIIDTHIPIVAMHSSLRCSAPYNFTATGFDVMDSIMFMVAVSFRLEVPIKRLAH